MHLRKTFAPLLIVVVSIGFVGCADPKPEDAKPLTPEQLIDGMREDIRPYLGRKLSRKQFDEAMSYPEKVAVGKKVSVIMPATPHDSTRVKEGVHRVPLQFGFHEVKTDKETCNFRIHGKVDENRSTYDFDWVGNADAADWWKKYENNPERECPRIRITGIVKSVEIAEEHWIELGLSDWKMELVK
jgi:hypothetical protein